jgi:hypothetical protein
MTIDLEKSNNRHDRRKVIDVSSLPFDTTQAHDPLELEPAPLVDQAARPPIVFYLSVEGLGGGDYSLRIELPAYDDHLQSVGQILAQINQQLFALNWWGDRY